MARPIITLTTDYGTSDHLVGAMKGVILSINPEVNIVDITHSVLAHDILDGALAIGQAYKYFPSKTVHVVVVDPSVGTERRPILVAGDTQYFVAPDNGVLSSIYDQSEALYAWNIVSEHYFRNPVSKTFPRTRHFRAGCGLDDKIMADVRFWRADYGLRAVRNSEAKSRRQRGEGDCAPRRSFRKFGDELYA